MTSDDVLDERFSGLSDDEISVLDKALEALDPASLDSTQYQILVGLRIAVDIQLTERNYDPSSTIEWASGPAFH